MKIKDIKAKQTVEFKEYLNLTHMTEAHKQFLLDKFIISMDNVGIVAHARGLREGLK